MKQFAIFLPQFHEIPENDQWWGKGFTEWVNVKKGLPLFSGHDQPKIPLNGNYYNLLEKKTMEWQTDLLHQYRLDGFAYYHYYFNGELLLEKPAENLLKWKDINQSYYFIWANHPWIRSWEGKSTVLMSMDYGNEKDWEKHFLYLLKFFKDTRYEKKDNKPLFEVFKSNIPNKNEMFEYFNNKCKEEGFNGIYIIESFGSPSKVPFPINYARFLRNISDFTQAIHIRQPAFCEYNVYNPIRNIINIYYRQLKKSKYKFTNRPLILNGNEMIDRFLKINIPHKEKEIIPSVFFEWDNTPRHKKRGYIISGINKEHFFKYMNSIKTSEYILYNAWNEWGEGMMLEPSNTNEYKYLEWIKEWTNLNK